VIVPVLNEAAHLVPFLLRTQLRERREELPIPADRRVVHIAGSQLNAHVVRAGVEVLANASCDVLR
jgi:hypothetical protein